jgi:putative Ca2+/H+ antiporter (TMEM165/GDT1 family)
MAMRYNRIVVYSGAIGALIIMTVLSVVIGVAVPALMSRKYTHYAAAFLFAYFGAKLLYEASQMQPGQVSEELQEAEEHLAEKGVISRGDGKVDEEMGNLEKNGENTDQVSSGADTASAAQQRHSKTSTVASVDSNNTATTTTTTSQLSSTGSKIVSPISLSTWANEWPILAQAFTITFVAEWGDRSQIATIAMAAAQNALGITIGACIGHALVTGLAVVGGRMLSSRISERAVAIAGGSLFLIFSLHSLYVGPN